MSVQQKLGKLADLVTIEKSVDGTIIVKPHSFLDKEKQWTPINKILRQENSKWVPIPGAIGHWEVPSPHAEGEMLPLGEVRLLLKKALALVEEELK